MKMKRKTIKSIFEISGIGLHKGKKSKLIFKPVFGNSGIRFINPGFYKPIKVCLENVHSTFRGTNLTNGRDIVYTVEHILSAIFAFGIDDVDIEIYGNEPPALDGSAKLYSELIKKAGICISVEEKASYFNFSEDINYEEKGSSYQILKSDKFEIECVYENSHPLIGRQEVIFEIKPEIYEKEIAPARTFGFEEEVDYLKKNDLALGGNLENAIIIGKAGILNKEPLRYKNEFVRHKLLDFLGDLKLAELHFENVKISAIRPSHEKNINFVKLLKR